MSVKRSPLEEDWLKNHSRDLPSHIESHPESVVPGRRESLYFTENDPPRVGGQRIYTVGLSALDRVDSEGNTISFEQNVSDDWLRADSPDWEEDELLLEDLCNGEMWLEDDDRLYFLGQRWRQWRSRLRYFESIQEADGVKKCRGELDEIKRWITTIKEDGLRTRTYRLTARQRQVLDLMWEGLSQAEVARRLGVSRAAVSRIVQRIKERTDGAVAILGADPKPQGPGLLQAAGPPRKRQRGG
jgi:hypothetical protein